MAESNVQPPERRGSLKLGVMVSGRGTNLQAIMDAIEAGDLDAEVVLVVCNHADAQAVTKAKSANVPVRVYELNDYPSRLAKQRAIAHDLAGAGAELIVCAGWDRVLKPEFVEQFEGRIINVHPSLLPAFGGGLHAIEEALSYGVKVAGCTVHFVTEKVDEGPIISQAAVPVLPDDTAETLAERIHPEEHRLLVEAIKLYTEGRLAVDGRRVNIKSEMAVSPHTK
ncbi:MAG TPA: phosphoribosylglycinamide formyltransferase [Chloroflexia bacterium]|nr:phosphoribosylglycinamide formyltransferase [Chloroflexia bacterium]